MEPLTLPIKFSIIWREGSIEKSFGGITSFEKLREELNILIQTQIPLDTIKIELYAN